MEDLLSNFDFDAVTSPIGLVIALVALRVILGAFKTAVKLAFILVLAVGAYLFFFGGQLPIAGS